MKAAIAIEPFPFPGAAVHVTPAHDASLLQADAVEARLRHAAEGHLLGVFRISTADQLHAEWEMHPAGDEVLIMLTGALSVMYSDGSRSGTASLSSGHGLVVPRGVWHRLVLVEPGLLLSLSPLKQTRLAATPEAS